MRNRFLTILFLFCFICRGSASSLENSTTLYGDGASMAKRGDIDGAVIAFKKVIEISPYYALGHYGLGKAYLYKSGMLDEAIIHLKRSVELDRKLARGFFYLGIACMFGKKYTQSIRAFKQCYEVDDLYVEALYNLGSVYDIIGRNFEATYYFQKYYTEKSREDKDVLF